MKANIFIDPRDGEAYKTVQLLDGREWFAENLRFACEGSIEPDPTASRRQRLSPYTAYDIRKYGRLYTWKVAQIACPPGWSVPSLSEWREMLNHYGGYLVAHDARDNGKQQTVERLQKAGFDVMPGPFDGRLHWDHFEDLEQAQFWSSTARGVFRKLNPFASPPRSAHYFLFGYCAAEHSDLCSFNLSVRCLRARNAY